MLRMLCDGDMAPRHLGRALGHAGCDADDARDEQRTGRRPQTMPARITLREVSLREGQHCFGPAIPLGLQCDWILIAYAAGLRYIAVGACLSSERKQQADDTLEVAAFAATLPDLQVCVTVHDAQSARRAFDHGVNLVTIPLVMGDPQATGGARRSTKQLLNELRNVCRARDEAGTAALVEARIAAWLPGLDVPQYGTQALARAALEAGCDVIGLADTSRSPVPAQVQRVFADVSAMAGSTPVSAHLRDDGDAGLVAVRAVLLGGATLLDFTLAGGGRRQLDGTAPSDVAALLHAQGMDTGLDLRTLGELRDFAARHAAPSAH
jgi:hydroxymethylglutaryl-CoA lyase